MIVGVGVGGGRVGVGETTTIKIYQPKVDKLYGRQYILLFSSLNSERTLSSRKVLTARDSETKPGGERQYNIYKRAGIHLFARDRRTCIYNNIIA